MKTITLEEHFASPSFLDGPGKELKSHYKDFTGPRARLFDQLCDVDERRISDMDDAGIDMQVLSLTAPGVEQVTNNEAIEISYSSNEFLAEAISRNPSRLAGFATIPTLFPDKAAAELERTVIAYGFKGAVINGHVGGRYLDDKFFWPVFERAEALQVPIYLHPTQPPQAVVDTYYGGFNPAVSFMFANSGWGWHIETGVHILRLILGGVFDRFPDLQIIIGHLGEALPFMIQRVDNMPPEMTHLKYPVSYYLRNNIHYTFSGFNFTPTFIDLFLQVGVNRIMFSADYPYAIMSEARAFLNRLPVSPADREQIAHGNAERLLKM